MHESWKWNVCCACYLFEPPLGSLMVEEPRLRLPLRLVRVVALGIVPWLQWVHPSFRPKDNWRFFSHCVARWISVSVVLMVTIPRRLWGRDTRCLSSAAIMSMSGVLFR
jgi:hypothetical protein